MAWTDVDIYKEFIILLKETYIEWVSLLLCPVLLKIRVSVVQIRLRAPFCFLDRIVLCVIKKSLELTIFTLSPSEFDNFCFSFARYRLEISHRLTSAWTPTSRPVIEQDHSTTSRRSNSLHSFGAKNGNLFSHKSCRHGIDHGDSLQAEILLPSFTPACAPTFGLNAVRIR
ncbi:hypothetical protein H4S14_001210 [Agrobacterium vitis]|nr:hypothetical protein [Agrobacterium vitis]MBE1437479.1 hypothetical protein [Agrobacterium vitis]